MLIYERFFLIDEKSYVFYLLSGLFTFYAFYLLVQIENMVSEKIIFRQDLWRTAVAEKVLATKFLGVVFGTRIVMVLYFTA